MIAATVYVSAVRDRNPIHVIESQAVPDGVDPVAFAQRIRNQYPPGRVLVEVIEDDARPWDPPLLSWLPGQKLPLRRPT